MKKIYGNHLGIVINNKDPENRGRVQIFIPHLTGTIYESWNKELNDISIKGIEDIPKNILEKLKQILPWAECASPVFGGSTSVFTDSDQTAKLPIDIISSSDPLNNEPHTSTSYNDVEVILKISKLSNTSKKKCGRGVRELLNAYTGKNIKSMGVDSAKDFGPRLILNYGMFPVEDVGFYKNGDVRVLQPNQGVHGHVEFFYNGKWYSDFKQKNSSLNNPRYHSPVLYRLP